MINVKLGKNFLANFWYPVLTKQAGSDTSRRTPQGSKRLSRLYIGMTLLEKLISLTVPKILRELLKFEKRFFLSKNNNSKRVCRENFEKRTFDPVSHPVGLVHGTKEPNTLSLL